jgi:hypothetical protein
MNNKLKEKFEAEFGRDNEEFNYWWSQDKTSRDDIWSFIEQALKTQRIEINKKIRSKIGEYECCFNDALEDILKEI